MTQQRRSLNSAVVIARLLDTEGFTDYTANRCEQWWNRNRVKTEGQHRRVAKLEAALTKLCAEKLTDADKYLLGKFIGMKIKQGFETGLAIGLTVSAIKTAQKIESDI